MAYFCINSVLSGFAWHILHYWCISPMRLGSLKHSVLEVLYMHANVIMCVACIACVACRPYCLAGDVYALS